eukprot:747818-Hanusia_phi.AAC.5
MVPVTVSVTSISRQKATAPPVRHPPATNSLAWSSGVGFQTSPSGASSSSSPPSPPAAPPAGPSGRFLNSSRPTSKISRGRKNLCRQGEHESREGGQV